MKAVIQRVRRGSVSVDGEILSEIGAGLVILLGVGPQDDEDAARKLAEKIARMRIFPDGERKMNISLLDMGGEALVIPQFTLYADTRRGHRPSFTDAGSPDLARPLSAAGIVGSVRPWCRRPGYSLAYLAAGCKTAGDAIGAWIVGPFTLSEPVPCGFASGAWQAAGHQSVERRETGGQGLRSQRRAVNLKCRVDPSAVV